MEMKKNNVSRYIFFAAVGLIMFLTGFVLLVVNPEVEGVLLTLPYIFVGVGAGIFGANLGAAIKNRVLLKDSKAAKQFEIEQKDERNQIIMNKAKAQVYHLMIFVNSAVMMSFAVMQVELYVVLTLVAVYIFFILAYVYYFNKYSKEM